jgi:anti-anti-sigma factor
MTFSAELTVEHEIATITLAGDLDASTAPEFQKQVEEAARREPKKLVLRMEKLNYMASAGLRVLVFSKQKMGNAVAIYVVGPQETVKNTLENTGFHHSVILMDEYDPKIVG